MIRVLLLLLPVCAQAADLAGKHWRVSERVQCRAGLLAIDLRVRYLGPAGAVEAPVVQMDSGRVRPASVSWRQGSRMLAGWLSAGGLRNIQPGELGEVEVKFNAGGTTFEFGDVPAFSFDAKACRLAARSRHVAAPAKFELAVHRARYPCTPSRSIAADHPPYLPKQLLLFGRGYLPNAREVDLPMGRAPAQSYAYAGPDELDAIEDAARRAASSDFPQYGISKYYAFNWGVQKAASGNEMYSIGFYAIRPCPK